MKFSFSGCKNYEDNHTICITTNDNKKRRRLLYRELVMNKQSELELQVEREDYRVNSFWCANCHAERSELIRRGTKCTLRR